jgi:ubiquitin carboxyl-terminal hydrolase 4/11
VGQVVTAAAYLLFYRRREDHPLGGPVLRELLETAKTNADSEAAQANPSREPSPHSGEGRRLGDSSHNGSSSAFAAGQTHRVGDGGPATTKITNMRWTTGAPQEDGSPLKSVETTNDDDSLPPYSETEPDPGGMMQHFSRNMSEGFEIDGPTYGPHAPWHDSSAWSFGNVKPQGPAPSPDLDATVDDEDLFQDSASTKVEDGDDDSGRGSPIDWPASDGEIDSGVLDLMDTSGGGGRCMRESAPPPDGMDVDVKERPIIMVTPDPIADDDEDELPIAELHA